LGSASTPRHSTLHSWHLRLLRSLRLS
jgi:hypothetical protein